MGDERVIGFTPHNGSITVISIENARLQLEDKDGMRDVTVGFCKTSLVRG